MQVIYTAAHAVPSSESIPLGGGAAIARRLAAEWTRTQPFRLNVIGPSILGNAAPTGRDIVSFSESAYARFCGAFERATTEEILRHDPGNTVVLANDISEGPDFARLHAAGFRTAAIFHVDVVDYIASIYLRGWVRPETTVRWFARLRHLPMPQILKLIWQKQGDCVRYANHLIVPSAAMKATLERCYPTHAPEKVLVLPWGSEPVQPGLPADLRNELNIPHNAKVLLTLSRISPEKGQHLLLQSLLNWERSATPPQEPIHLLLCGEAAYMQGRKYAQKLHSLAAQLRHIRIHFPGHVSGLRKAACFALADLYIFPSIHESYGLTLMEALAAGLPAICLPSHGSTEVMPPDCGAIVTPDALWPTIRHWLADESLRTKAGINAAAFAASHTFALTAQQLARHIQ
ncbi:MAG: glycosyltransferase family 4 protein [Bryobacteraceae bacterium]